MNIDDRKDSNSIVVSIQCTAYNHEKYIRDTLEGFVMQKRILDLRLLYMTMHLLMERLR